MPQGKKEFYKITNNKTGAVHTFMMDHEPTDADIQSILATEKQDTIARQAIKNADRSLLNPDYVKQAGKDVAKTVVNPSNALMMGLTVAAPEIGIPLATAMSGAGLIKKGIETYQNPNNINKIELLGSALGTGLGVAGVRKYGNLSNTMESLSNLGSRVKNAFRGPIDAEFVNGPSGAGEPFTDVPYKVKTPLQLNAPQPQETAQIPSGQNQPQLPASTGGPIVTPPPTSQPTPPQKLLPQGRGPIVTPPPPTPESSVTGSSPKGVVYQEEGLVRDPKTGTMIKANKANKVRSIFTSESAPAPASSIKPEITKPEGAPVKEEAQPPADLKSGELKHKFLNTTDDNTLKIMQPGATGQMRTEIDSVLKRRGINMPLTTESGEAIPNSANQQTYQNMLNDLTKIGKETNTSNLRDIAKAGKDAGLDQATINGHLLEKLHPEVTNPAGKVSNALDKVFSSKKE